MKEQLQEIKQNELKSIKLKINLGNVKDVGDRQMTSNMTILGDSERKTKQPRSPQPLKKSIKCNEKTFEIKES